MEKAVIAAAVALAAMAMGGGAGAAVTLKPVGAVYGLFTRPWPATEKIEPVQIAVAGAGKVTLTATDVFGKPVAWREDLTLSGEQTVAFAAGMGFYHIEARQDSAVAATLEIGIVPPPHPGVRKDSFFASNTSSVRTGEELRFLETIGMKVQRTHFLGTTPAQMDELKQHGLWVLPIVGYSVGAKSEWATKLSMHGPPADYNLFVSEWEKCVRQFPEIETWEFWNEPWIFGWTWADTPEAYRKLQTLWSQMCLRVNPKARIIAGNSWMFAEDHIEPYPDCWKGLLRGTSHHPYSGAGDLSFRSGVNCRSVDAGGLVTRAMGLPYYYLTEGGTSVGSAEFGTPVPGIKGPNNLYNARKVVQYFVRAAQAGCFQGDMQWGIGYAPDWTMSNTSFAVLTHLTEDRPIVADVWPENELISGAIFANPRWVTDEVKALPRAGDLSARWGVPVPADRVNDATKVAVVWSWTGPSNDAVDTTGTLTIDDPTGVRAYDLMGREIPPRGRLSVPFGENPVYFVGDTLSVMELRGRIAGARIDGVTPVNAYALSLTEPADGKQNLIVRIENQLNAEVAGHLSVQIAGRGTIASVPFTAPAAKLVEVAVPWPGVKAVANNQYPINVIAKAETVAGHLNRTLRRFVRSQILESAQFVRRAVTPDGALDDWQGVAPVVLTSAAKVDYTRYLLNPSMKAPETEPVEKATARVYTAYDDQYVYVAVQGWPHKTTVGEPAYPGLPYRKGEPKGLEYISNCGDIVQIAFGFRDRVPGHGRQMDDPWAWKGQFYDTDYQYAAYMGPDGPQLMREWGPDTDRRTAYQIDDVPYVAPVEGAKVAIANDVYEIAIPRSELALFDPGRDRLRFGVVLNGTYNWADTAGVFDYWNGSGSFGPSWSFRLPCQTFFGIAR